MILFTENITNRLQFVCEFVGNEIFNQPIKLTNNKSEFLSSREPKLNYSNDSLTPEEFHLVPHRLLFENDIRTQQISCKSINGNRAFFMNDDGHFPFDLFAATFYLLSRYEEYLPHQKDEYGRFSHKESLAFREGFLHLPLINLWLEDFKLALRDRIKDLHFHRKTFKFIPTYDIDIAWKYKHKGWIRNIGGCFNSAVKGDWSILNERIAVLRNNQKDPFEAYEWLDALHLYCRMKPYYFFLLAEKPKGYDKNISPSNRQLQQLVAYHAARDRVGIHPSWQSGDNRKLLKEEIGWLEFITGEKPKYSRQHYIRFELPDSMDELIRSGIEKDFSMGYGDVNGFRASVASSFKWFNLLKNETTSLTIFPFCFMDANAFYEQKLTAQQAFTELMQYYYVVKKVNGLLITIWHNNFLGSEKVFKPWKNVYELFLKEEVYWDS
jgi:hypothetical protein